MKAFLAALVLVLVFVPGAYAADNADKEVYIDWPVGNWRLTESTCVYNAFDMTAPHSFQRSVSVRINPGEMLRFRHTWEGEKSNGASHIQFFMKAVSPDLTHIKARVRVSGNLRTPVTVLDYVAGVEGDWLRIELPFTALNASNVNIQTVDFFIDAAAPAGQREFNIDTVKFIKPPFTGVTTVNVDPGITLREFQKTHFGLPVFPANWLLHTPETRARLQQTGASLISFPGGVAADTYDWVNNRNVRDGTTGSVNTDMILEVADGVDAEKLFIINYGSGTPENARDWLYYTNIIKGADVLHWSVGNENYEIWSYDIRPPPFRHDAWTYANFVSECITQMKAIDPRIKIGVNGPLNQNDYPQRFTVTNPRTGQPANGWGAVLLARLAELGTLPDYYSYQYYVYFPNHESDALLLQRGKRFEWLFPFIRQMLLDYLGPQGANVAINITENNNVPAVPGKQSTSIVNALYLVEACLTAVEQGSDVYVWWNFMNPATNGNVSPALYGWRQHGNYGIISLGVPAIAPPPNTPYPTFYGYRMLSRFARGGDEMVQATSDNELISAFASKQGKNVKILLLNKAVNTSFAVNVNLPQTGWSPTGRSVKAHVYSTYHDENMLDIETIQLRAAPNSNLIRVTLPPYTMMVIEP